MSDENGRCVACKNFPWEKRFKDLALCLMCWSSPFYVARRKVMAENDQTETHVPIAAGGLRFDEGKSRVDLIPADAMLELGRVYEAGDRKYRPLGGPRNWEKGMPWTKVLGPLMRHLFHWMMGETFDPEDGQRHIAKVAWNAIALLTYELRKIGIDDRYKPPKT